MFPVGILSANNSVIESIVKRRSLQMANKIVNTQQVRRRRERPCLIRFKACAVSTRSQVHVQSHKDQPFKKLLDVYTPCS